MFDADVADPVQRLLSTSAAPWHGDHVGLNLGRRERREPVAVRGNEQTLEVTFLCRHELLSICAQVCGR